MAFKFASRFFAPGGDEDADPTALLPGDEAFATADDEGFDPYAYDEDDDSPEASDEAETFHGQAYSVQDSGGADSGAAAPPGDSGGGGSAAAPAAGGGTSGASGAAGAPPGTKPADRHNRWGNLPVPPAQAAALATAAGVPAVILAQSERSGGSRAAQLAHMRLVAGAQKAASTVASTAATTAPVTVAPAVATAARVLVGNAQQASKIMGRVGGFTPAPTTRVAPSTPATATPASRFAPKRR